MKAKVLVYALPALILAIIHLAEAQQPKKVARIGYLGSSRTGSTDFKLFSERLHDLGYIEGQNITIESRSFDGEVEHLPELAAELVRLQCDVIVTTGTEAAV